MPAATLLSVNVGLPREIGLRRGRPVRSAIAKTPIDGPVAVSATNLAGDAQADLEHHGGAHKAVYAYASKDAAWWGEQLGRAPFPGMLGENLTTAGVDCSGAVIGERWRIGSALLEVAEPRIPCFKLALHLGERTIVRRFAKASRPGAYLRVIEPGTLAAGDAIELVERPDHGVTTALVFDAILHDRALVPRALQAPQLGPDPLGALRERAARRA